MSDKNDRWWGEINDLALLAAMRPYIRHNTETQATYNSHLIGAARVIGVPEDEIRRACESDRQLTIYEP